MTYFGVFECVYDYICEQFKGNIISYTDDENIFLNNLETTIKSYYYSSHIIKKHELVLFKSDDKCIVISDIVKFVKLNKCTMLICNNNGLVLQGNLDMYSIIAKSGFITKLIDLHYEIQCLKYLPKVELVNVINSKRIPVITEYKTKKYITKKYVKFLTENMLLFYKG